MTMLGLGIVMMVIAWAIKNSWLMALGELVVAIDVALMILNRLNL